MRLKFLAVLFSALLLPGQDKGMAKRWQFEPDGFKGVKFLSSEQKAKKALPDLTCIDSAPAISQEPERHCLLQIDANGWFILASFQFTDDKLRAVYGEFDTKQFDAALKLFLKKYGRPTSASPAAENLTLFWTGKRINLVLERQYSEAKSSFLFALREDLDAEIRKGEEAKKDISPKK